MENPFEIILERLDRIEKAIEKLENKTSSVHTNNPMNCKDLSEYLKISLSAIYKLIYKGSIPHYKNGRKLFFKREEINDWIFSTAPELLLS